MPTPQEYRYSESHEWFHREGDVITLGITRYAVDELTDITYVEMKPAGSDISPGGPVGEVESVKTTSDIYSVIGGEVVTVNQAVVDDPSLVNSDPYGKGWLVKIRTTDPSPLDALLDHASYAQRHPVG